MALNLKSPDRNKQFFPNIPRKYAQIMALGPNMTHLVGQQERGQFPINTYSLDD